MVKEIKEFHKNSTQVVGWYAHPGQVRGPFCRWFEITDAAKGNEKHVAEKYDDAKYCAAAMNYAIHLANFIEKEALEPDYKKLYETANAYIVALEKELQSPDTLNEEGRNELSENRIQK